jgi:hypothetical protein
MATTPIPEHWKNAVRQKLTSNPASVFLRRSARQDWCDMFPGAFNTEIYGGIADALETPDIQGRQITTMIEPGEVWEFIFKHQGYPVYTKINLCPDQTIIIYSAHRPLKGETL